MDTLLAFLVAAAVTLFFVRNYLHKLTANKESAAAPIVLAKCPRCAKTIPRSATFCQHCGTSQDIWTVHRASIQAAGVAQGLLRPVVNASICMGCGSCVHACPEAGALEVVSGRSMLVNPDACTGQAKCADVCPTQALTLSGAGAAQTIRVPNIKESFETNVPGIYIVGELGGLGMIKRAVNEGKLAVDHLRDRLQAEPLSAGGESIYDLAIVGAGPAGLSAALTAQQYGLSYIVLEQAEIASTIRQYPRHKFVMAEPIQMPLYGSLYVADATKESLVSVWETIISNTGVQVRTNECVQRVQRHDVWFHVETSKATYDARYVLLALGRRGTPRRLGVPGEDLPKVSYRLIEAGEYRDKDLLVVGGGDSAVEAALALANGDGNRVTLCHRRANFDRLRDRNRERLETAEASGVLRLLRQAIILEIGNDSVVVECNAQTERIANDFVFIMAGGESSEDFLRKMGVEMVERVLTGNVATAMTAD